MCNLTNLSDNGSDFRWNRLADVAPEMRLFLKRKQIGGDVESYQIAAIPLRIEPARHSENDALNPLASGNHHLLQREPM